MRQRLTSLILHCLHLSLWQQHYQVFILNMYLFIVMAGAGCHLHDYSSAFSLIVILPFPKCCAGPGGWEDASDS